MKLTAAQKRAIQKLTASLPPPCVDCAPTGGSHMQVFNGGLARCHCKRGDKLREIDEKYRPQMKPKKRRFDNQPRQQRLTNVPDWGKNAAGDDT